MFKGRNVKERTGRKEERCRKEAEERSVSGGM
jgi:hypothetical protein